MTSAVPGRSSLLKSDLLPLFLAAALFVGLRALGWLNSPELEGHDSVAYLRWAEVFRSGDWHAIFNLDPDAAPLFPLLIAIFSFLPGDLEAAARLVSSLSSIATMAAVYLIGKHASNHLCGVLAIVLCAVSPWFLRMSYAVFSEPLYIGLFSWIVLIFISTAGKPSLKSGLALGVLSGLAFLTRVEAVLLIAALPLLHFCHAMVTARNPAFFRVAKSNLILILVMAAIAAPQVIRVSSVMNSFALNGRDAWSVILANPDRKSRDDKLSGLDYDPKITNLRYLQTHPEALRQMARNAGYATILEKYARNAKKNLRSLHDGQLVLLVGLPVLVFAGIGFLALLKDGRSKDALLLAAFMGIALAAPLIYKVTLRHLLILVPFLCVFASRGIIETASVLSSHLLRGKRLQAVALFASLAVAIMIPGKQSAGFLSEPDNVNGEHNEATLRRPLAIVNKFSETSTQPARILARKAYLSHYSNSGFEQLPYTDLAGLLNYLAGRQFDFLFYEEQHLKNYPFAAEIGSVLWLSHFELIYSSGEAGTGQALYALRQPGEYADR